MRPATMRRRARHPPSHRYMRGSTWPLSPRADSSRLASRPSPRPSWPRAKRAESRLPPPPPPLSHVPRPRRSRSNVTPRRASGVAPWRSAPRPVLRGSARVSASYVPGRWARAGGQAGGAAPGDQRPRPRSGRKQVCGRQQRHQRGQSQVGESERACPPQARVFCAAGAVGLYLSFFGRLLHRHLSMRPRRSGKPRVNRRLDGAYLAYAKQSILRAIGCRAPLAVNRVLYATIDCRPTPSIVAQSVARRVNRLSPHANVCRNSQSIVEQPLLISDNRFTI